MPSSGITHRLAIVAALLVALCSAGRAAADDVLAIETFEGSPVFPYPYYAPVNIIDGRSVITGPANGQLTERVWHFVMFALDLPYEAYPAITLAFDFTAHSDAPFANGQTIMSARTYFVGVDWLPPISTPPSASNTALVGDGVTTDFFGEFAISGPEIRGIGTLTITGYLDSPNQTLTIDNLRVIGLTLPGDANNDGIVDNDDMAAVEQNFGELRTGVEPLIGDANHDGRVDGDDVLSVERNFGHDLSTIGVPLVPEPACLMLLLAGSLALLRRR